jgi:hypothetical protein
MSRRVIPRQKGRERVHVGAFIPREQRHQLIARAREEDRGVGDPPTRDRRLPRQPFGI